MNKNRPLNIYKNGAVQYGLYALQLYISLNLKYYSYVMIQKRLMLAL